MVSACATDPIQLPSFQKAERSAKEVVDPVDLPQLCEVPWTSVACWGRLDVFDDVAIGNTELAQLNADIARLGEGAYDDILAAAEKQQGVALIREDMLQAERRDHFWDVVWHRALIFVMAVGMIL